MHPRFAIRIGAVALVALSGSALALTPQAPRILGFQLSNDRTHLVLTTGPRSAIDAPRLSKNQAGYDQPVQSPDGRTLGWLALQYSFGQQYVRAEQLVLYRDGRVLRVFDSEQPIMSWSFAVGGEAVAWSQSAAADSSSRHYSLRRIRDGLGLADFQCQLSDSTSVAAPASSEVPDWVWPIASGCPLR